MRKKELLEIPIALAQCTRKLKKHLLIAHEELLKNNTKVLVVEVYYSFNKHPNYRIFLTESEDITLDCTGGKQTWKTGSIYQYTSWYREEHFLEDVSSNKIIREFCKGHIDEKGCRMIMTHQNIIREKRLLKQHKKITDPWDKVMETIPEVPSDFKEWVEETAMSFSRYIFYKYTGKQVQTGWCSHCKNYVKIDGAMNGHKTVCPCCNSVVTLRADGKLSSLYDDKEVFLIQKVDNRLLIRRFNASRRLRKKMLDWDCENSIYESKRIFIDLNGCVEETYSYECFKQRKTRWVKCDASLHWLGSGALYSSNLDEILERTKYKHTGLKNLAEYEQGFEFNVGKFFGNFDKFPFIEYLIKNQLCEIAKDYIDGNGNNALDKKAKTIDKLLQVEKYDIKFLQENKANITGLRYLQDRRKNNQKPIAEHMEFVQTIFNGKLGDFLEFTKHTKPGKVIKYLKNNKRISLDNKKKYVSLWRDYIGMAERLGYDLTNDFVMFPRYLKLRHDQCINVMNEQREQLKVKAQKTENRKVEKRYKETLAKYGMDYKDLVIVVPKTAQDIIKEGHDMHHCVGGYVSRVAAGQTTILFIRKKDKLDESYYTLEVKGDEVIQCRGKYNHAMTPDVSAFIQRFKKDKSKQRRKAS